MTSQCRLASPAPCGSQQAPFHVARGPSPPRRRRWRTSPAEKAAEYSRVARGRKFTWQVAASRPDVPDEEPDEEPKQPDLDGTANLGCNKAPGKSNIVPASWLRDSSKQKAARKKQLADRKLYVPGWYNIGEASALAHGPYMAELMGTSVVVFLDTDNKIKALRNVCFHRGGLLHKRPLQEVDGKLCVECHYHGWRFGGEGEVLCVPAKCQEGCLPTERLQTFEVKEKGGFLWLWASPEYVPSEKRSKIPYTPQLKNSMWQAVPGQIHFACGHHAVFENAIDFAHIFFVHAFGSKASQAVRNLKVTTKGDKVKATFTITAKRTSRLLALLRQPEEQVVEVTSRAMLPSTSAITFKLAFGMSFVTYVSVTPVDEANTIVRFALVRNWAHPLVNWFWNLRILNPFFHFAMMRVIGEDKAVVESLTPEQLLFEVSTSEDAMQKAYAAMRQKLLDAGKGFKKL